MSEKPFVVVIGTDFSKQADRALEAAFQQAALREPAELHVVHVSAEIDGDTGAIPYTLLKAPPLLDLEAQKAALVQHLDQKLATLPKFRESKLRVVAHVMVGTPSIGLARMASNLEANLIVVGTHGRNGVARWLLGSVAEGLVRQASCQVLIIPPEPTELPAPEIEPPCPRCVTARRESSGAELWCEQHREHHGRRHTYHQGDRVGAETNMPLLVR
jgi:nucleotide-binding universal stress UspA family protein